MTIDEYLAQKQVQIKYYCNAGAQTQSIKKKVTSTDCNHSHWPPYIVHKKPLVVASRKLEERMFLMWSGMEFWKVYEVINDIAEKFTLTLPISYDGIKWYFRGTGFRRCWNFTRSHESFKENSRTILPKKLLKRDNHPDAGILWNSHPCITASQFWGWGVALIISTP